MPRAASPAADAATPETAAPQQAAPATESEQPPAPEWTNWRYVGSDTRIYTSVPVTVTHGDVITHPGAPADDGWWEPTTDAVTKHPDNHPDVVAAADAAALKAADAALAEGGVTGA